MVIGRIFIAIGLEVECGQAQRNYESEDFGLYILVDNGVNI